MVYYIALMEQFWRQFISRSGICSGTVMLALALLLPAIAIAESGEGAIPVKTNPHRTIAYSNDDNTLSSQAYEALQRALESPLKLQHVDGYPPQLAEIWRQAAKGHPTIALLLSEIAVLEQKVAPAGAPPDPILSFGIVNHVYDDFFSWKSPMTRERVAIKQLLERGSKRDARKAVAEADIMVQAERVAVARYAIGERLLDSWFDLAETSVRLKQLDRNRQLFKALREVIRTRYELNRAPQSDLLAAEEKLAELESRQIELEAMLDTLKARLASSAGLAVNDLPELDVSTMPTPAVDEPEDWEAIFAEVAKAHPESALFDAVGERIRAQRNVIRLDYRADPTIEAAWSFSPKHDDFISLGVSIPLRIHNDERVDPKMRETYIKEDQIPLMREELRVRIRSGVQMESAKLQGIPGRRRVIETMTLPLLKQSFDSQLAVYQTGKIPLADILRTTLDIIDTETSLLLLDIEEARAAARADYLTLGLLRRPEA